MLSYFLPDRKIASKPSWMRRAECLHTNCSDNVRGCAGNDIESLGHIFMVYTIYKVLFWKLSSLYNGYLFIIF